MLIFDSNMGEVGLVENTYNDVYDLDVTQSTIKLDSYFQMDMSFSYHIKDVILSLEFENLLNQKIDFCILFVNLCHLGVFRIRLWSIAIIQKGSLLKSLNCSKKNYPSERIKITKIC